MSKDDLSSAIFPPNQEITVFLFNATGSGCRERKSSDVRHRVARWSDPSSDTGLYFVFFSFGEHSWQRLHHRGLLENKVPDKDEISNSSAIVRYRHLFVVSINQSLKFR